MSKANVEPGEGEVRGYVSLPALHRANQFNFHPLREVAILFAGGPAPA